MKTLSCLSSARLRRVMFLLVTAFMMLALSACQNDDIELLQQPESSGAAQNAPSAGGAAANPDAPVSSGEQPLSSGAAKPAQGVQPTAEPGGVVSSDGQSVPGQEGGDGQPASAPGMPPAIDNPLEGAVPFGEAPKGWVVYEDPNYKFSFRHPDIYLYVEDIELLNGMRGDVRFLDKDLAASPLAAYEPPVFGVQIFERPAGQSLQNFLKEKDWLPEGAEVQSLQLKGAAEGFKVTLPIQLAPNEIYYYATPVAFYRITALGPYAEEMLKSFQLEE